MERENQPAPSIQTLMGAQLKIIWVLFVWSYFSMKKEKRKILKNLNHQKPGEEEGHLICVKSIFEFQLQRKFNNSVFVMLN